MLDLYGYQTSGDTIYRHFSWEKKSFVNGKEICRRAGANLPRLTTQGDRQFLDSVFGDDWTWVGGLTLMDCRNKQTKG